jgi:hypothetical protein
VPKGKHSEGYREDTPPEIREEEPGPEEVVGPRRAALRLKRRKQRLRAAGLVAVASALIAAGLSLGNVFEGDGGSDPGERVAPHASKSIDRVRTLLLIGTRTNELDEARVVWLALLSSERNGEAGSVAYIPAHTAVEVPGRGLQGLDDSWETGGVPLLLVSMENLLGISIDGYVELATNDALVLFENIGELVVNVPNEVRVPAGRDQVRLLFGKGSQRLDATFLVELLYTVGVDGDDVELGSRHLAFWDALFDTYERDPDSLVEAFVAAGGALASSGDDPTAIASIFGDLARLEGVDRIVNSLPVSPLEVPGNRLYAVDAQEIEDFVSEVVGESEVSSDLVRVQVLNGNGVPGIGQEVASLLVGKGFRVILSGNAPRLNYRTTRVVTYDPSPEGQALAQRAVELLGVGEVQISAQEQGIVDLTIVVGRDFLRTR